MRVHGLVLVLGKGGEGNTTIAAAVAVELAARGYAVHLTTTDPAAQLSLTVEANVPGLEVYRSDLHLESERYGSACLAAMQEVARCAQVDGAAPAVVVLLDGDYSDHPECLPELVRPILAGDLDFVLGSRLLGAREPGAMPLQSIDGNKRAC